MEIQAQDLRIGNIIRCKDNDKIVPAFRGKIVPVDITILRLIFECKPDYYEPIPLTEEILLKCGFADLCGVHQLSYRVKDGFYFFWNYNDKAGMCTEGIKDESCGWYHPENVVISGIEHLHTLQNLVYSLTGTELTVNL